jgi:hypothetical protein
MSGTCWPLSSATLFEVVLRTTVPLDGRAPSKGTEGLSQGDEYPRIIWFTFKLDEHEGPLVKALIQCNSSIGVKTIKPHTNTLVP